MNNSSTNFNFEWITDWETIYSDTFQKKWLHLIEHAENSHVFFHPSLSMAWIKTYRPIRDIKPLFCIARNNETTIFLPLIIWKKNWKNIFQEVIVPVGYSDFDYHDPLILKTSSIKETTNSFFNHLISELKIKYSFDLITINGLRSVANDKVFLQEKDVAPFSNIKNFLDGEDFLKSLKTKLRGDIRRQIRRLSDKGELVLIKHDGTDLPSNIIKVFLDFHTKRWPNAYKAPDFHHNLIDSGLKSGIVQFSELRIGNQTISWHLGFQYNKIFYYYMPAVDSEWENYSPGKVHLFKLMEEAIKNKLEIFDHLRGEENYKMGWTDSIQNLYEFNLYSTTLGARIKSKTIQLKNKLF